LESIRIGPKYRRSYFIALALAFLILLTAGILWHLRNQAWVEEVNFLRESIFDNHLLFDSYTLYNWQIPNEVMAHADDVRRCINVEADALIARIPWMSAREITFSLPRLIAVLKDGHSAIDPRLWQRTVTPFFFRYLTDGYYFYAYYDNGFPKRETEIALIGSRLVAVNGHAPEKVEDGYMQLNGCENAYLARANGYLSLMSPAMLTMMGLHDSFDTAPEYTLETMDGQVVTITPSGLAYGPVPTAAYSASPGYQERVILAKNNPYNRANVFKTGYEVNYLDGDTVLHFRCYNFSGPNVHQMTPDLEAALTDNPQLKRIIVDVRGNSGGYGDVAEAAFCAIRDGRPDLWQQGEFYVATDGGSYSASIYMANWLRTLCGATIVGEPTGQGLWFFFGAREIELPKSGLTVYLSGFHTTFKMPDTMYIDPEGLFDGADAIYPDVLIERTIEEYMADIDPVLDWILAQ